MSKFVWSNTNFEQAEVILIGIPDETGAKSYRSGTSNGPDQIRKISNQRELFGPNRIAQSMTGEIGLNVWDYGNISKLEVRNFINNILKNKKFPIIIGGDHSNTTEILRGYPKMDISLVYFDAHPDIIYSDRPYYGSTVRDVSDIVNLQKSVELGVREPEVEEIRTLREKNVLTITPFDMIEIGIKDVLKIIKERIGSNLYVSIDMDCFDPAFAPGVSTPSPGGFTSAQVIYLVKKLARDPGFIGLDIMETNPAFDINDMTSHLAARLIVETLTDLKIVHVY